MRPAGFAPLNLTFRSCVEGLNAPGLLWALAVVMLGCAPEPGREVVARFDGGGVTRGDLEAFDQAWPSELDPTIHLGDLREQALEQGLLPPDVAAYFASHWPELFTFDEPRSTLTRSADLMSDEDLARQYALQRVCGQRMRQSPGLRSSLVASERVCAVDLFFRALEAGHRYLSGVKVSGAAVWRYYEDHRSDYEVPAGMDIRHLFLQSGLYSDRPSRTEAEAEALALELFDRLSEGESFGQLIRQYSDSETRERGGWILRLQPDQTRAEVVQRLQAMEPGEIAPPIKTSVGVHLVQLVGRRVGQEIPLDQVSEDIWAYLLAEKRESLYRKQCDRVAESQAIQVTALSAETAASESVVLRVGERGYTLLEIEADLLGIERQYYDLDAQGRSQVVSRLAQVLLYLGGLSGQALSRYAALGRLFHEQAVAEEFLAGLAERRLVDQPEEPGVLEQYFEQNRSAYRQPWCARLSLAEIPLPEPIAQDPIGNYRRRQERFRQAKQLIEQLQAGVVNPGTAGIAVDSWRTQSAAYPLDELPVPLREAMMALAASHPEPASFPLVLREPVEQSGKLCFVRVLELTPARDLSFEEALPQVRRHFKEARRKEILRQLHQEILQESNFQMVVSR